MVITLKTRKVYIFLKKQLCYCLLSIIKIAPSISKQNYKGKKGCTWPQGCLCFNIAGTATLK